MKPYKVGMPIGNEKSLKCWQNQEYFPYISPLSIAKKSLLQYYNNYEGWNNQFFKEKKVVEFYDQLSIWNVNYVQFLTKIELCVIMNHELIKTVELYSRWKIYQME